METTIVIDDDIVAKLESEMQKRDGATFKEIVNETLRLGLQSQQQKHSFKVRARSMGIQKDLNYDKIGELIERIEGENAS